MWIIVFSAFSLGMVGTFIAVQLASLKKAWLNLGLGFGSGFLLAIAIGEMLPEAVEASSKAFFMVLLGFCLAYLLEHIFKSTNFMHIHGAEEEDSPEIIGFVAFLAISLHSLIDGIAIATALLSSFRVGIFVATAVVIHKIPDGFALGTLLIAKKHTKRSLLGLSFLLALATPVGAILSFYLLKGLSLNAGLFLGLSAGTFIYISTAHMLPEAHHAKAEAHMQISSSFIAGILLGLLPHLF